MDKPAIDAAFEALAEIVDVDEVGEHTGITDLTHNSATHHFLAMVEGYQGWEWNVVVACATGSKEITVSEVALVPQTSGEALQAPEWVPYSDRLQPGDLGPGDLMPPAIDDERLTDDQSDPKAIVIDAPGARKQYLTTTGLESAKARWRTGEFSPTSEFAQKSALHCATCAFYIPATELLGKYFGVCTNEYSADGVVVPSSYGCGAHSDTEISDPDLEPKSSPYDDERPFF